MPPVGVATSTSGGSCPCGPVTLTTVGSSCYRLAVACQSAAPSTLSNDIAWLLFDESVSILAADLVVDGHFLFLSFDLRPQRTAAHGSYNWNYLIEIVNRMISASTLESTAPGCTCQAFQVSLQGDVGPMDVPCLWDSLYSWNLRMMNFSLEHEPSTCHTDPTMPAAPTESEDSNDSAYTPSKHAQFTFTVSGPPHLFRAKNSDATDVERVTELCMNAVPQDCRIEVLEVHQDSTPAVPACLCHFQHAPAPQHNHRCPPSHFKFLKHGQRLFVCDGDSEVAGVKLFVDDTMSNASTCVEVECQNRQGLLFDVLRATLNSGMSIVQARLSSVGGGLRNIQLHLKNSWLKPLTDDVELWWYLHQLMLAIITPLSIAIVPGEGGRSDIFVLTLLGSKQHARQHGRPCMVRQVAKVLSSSGVELQGASIACLDEWKVSDHASSDVVADMVNKLSLLPSQRQELYSRLPTPVHTEETHDEEPNENETSQSLLAHVRTTYSDSDDSRSSSNSRSCPSGGSFSSPPASALVELRELPHGSSTSRAHSMRSGSEESCCSVLAMQDVPLHAALEDNMTTPFMDAEFPAGSGGCTSDHGAARVGSCEVPRAGSTEEAPSKDSDSKGPEKAPEKEPESSRTGRPSGSLRKSPPRMHRFTSTKLSSFGEASVHSQCMPGSGRLFQLQTFRVKPRGDPSHDPPLLRKNLLRSIYAEHFQD